MTSRQFRKSLFIFRRDLRLEDNHALLTALECSDRVLTCFIFDPRQIGKQPYRSSHAIQFMLASLEELAGEIERRGGRLCYFFGKAEEAVRQLLRKERCEAIFVNADYTPFSLARDAALRETAQAAGAAFCTAHDALLINPEELHKKGAGRYTVFTPFFKAAAQAVVAEPQHDLPPRFFSGPTRVEQVRDIARLRPPANPRIFRRGGRAEALRILSSLRRFKGYARERDLPAEEGTTGLSAHNKFGTVSIREVYHAVRRALGADHPLLRQLYWRDFFSYVAYHHPHVFAGAFHRRYDAIRWENNRKQFKAWCEGMTGFPLVDAGMRQLNATGFMHNRVRMVAASFLVKDLRIDWRWGERYFAQQLIDFDPAVNNGNWQWAASTGCDAQPYFRIFNPVIQEKKFDPAGSYIRRWVTALAKTPPRVIHRLADGTAAAQGYPPPLVDHALARTEAEELFEACAEKRSQHRA